MTTEVLNDELFVKGYIDQLVGKYTAWDNEKDRQNLTQFFTAGTVGHMKTKYNVANGTCTNIMTALREKVGLEKRDGVPYRKQLCDLLGIEIWQVQKEYSDLLKQKETKYEHEEKPTVSKEALEELTKPLNNPPTDEEIREFVSRCTPIEKRVLSFALSL